jgi:translation initiation factor 2B subunit (eIF-2B alpha/beta/delta family)
MSVRHRTRTVRFRPQTPPLDPAATMGSMQTPLSERVYELRRDRRHGASWMARRALEALVQEAAAAVSSSEDLWERLLAASRELAGSRPEVGAIAGALGRVLGAASHNLHLDPDELRRLVEEEATGLISSRRRAGASIAIQLRERVTDALVVTHSASSTVREALVLGKPAHVTCTVSAPNEEGRDFSEDLREAGLTTDLVADEDAPRTLESASLLLLGADTVFRDGTLCNKIGTLALAEAADVEGVHVVVACEVIKLAPVDGADAPELDAEAAELFDLTPPHLIDLFVTEEGSFDGGGVRPLVDRTPFLAEGYGLLRRS